jgi:general secretion pathway protein E
VNIEKSASLCPADVDRNLLRAVPISFAKRHNLLPVRRGEGEYAGYILVATADPKAYAPLDDLRALFGNPVLPITVSAETILSCINQLYERPEGGEQMMAELSADNVADLDMSLEERVDLLDAEDEKPIVALVHSLLYQAVKRRASDIHIEPFERELIIRYRTDGVLYNVLSPPKRCQNSIASRVKVMAGLDIAERRMPQDGRIRIRIAGRDVDIRVSIIPTAHGERIVLRLLERTGLPISFDSLGLLPTEEKLMERLIHLSHGLILVTGPTGSGKTTTLYAALMRINTPDKNLLTVEDPIEYQMSAIGQMQVNPKINLTFANGLRSILRQDPDIIMVGEIRDRETADIAIHASLTGHLVFSTLHTNDAAGAVTRLVDMGIEPFLVSSSLAAVVAQRLVRVLCPACKQAYRPADPDLAKVALARPMLAEGVCYRSVGCDSCDGTGYQGRTGIFEVLLIGEQLRRLILSNSDAGTLRAAAVARAMTTLKEAGARCIATGRTTIDEVIRVMQDEVTDACV